MPHPEDTSVENIAHSPYAIPVAVLALVFTLAGYFEVLPFQNHQSEQSPHHVSFITTTITSKEECTTESDAYLGRMVTGGTLPKGHAVRWSYLRKICLLAVTYDDQPKDGVTRQVAEIIDMTWKRRLFGFTTTGVIDPDALLEYNHDMDVMSDQKVAFAGM